MANSNNNLTDVFNDIATAINGKGVSGTMSPVEMADKIAAIPTGHEIFIADSQVGYTQLSNGSYLGHYTYSVGRVVDSAGNAAKINLSTGYWRICCKFMITGDMSTSGHSRMLIGSPDGVYSVPSMEVFNNGEIVGVGFNASGASQWTAWAQVENLSLAKNTWYYAVTSWKDNTGGLFVYDSTGQLIGSDTVSVNAWQNADVSVCWGGSEMNSYFTFDKGKFDLNESFIELNDICWWGSTNSKTANMGIITSS